MDIDIPTSNVVITDWYLVCSYNSINMDGTLMRKAMHADPENYVTSMAPGQYWTWGTHMRGMKGKIQWVAKSIHYNNTFKLFVFTV